MVRLAHVSDPHFQGFSGVKLRDFLGKRAVGGLNLLLRRRRKHRMELLGAMLEDLRGRAVDHVALTGDLCNIALASEWGAAVRWIGALPLSAGQVTVIPGNHDTYVPRVVADGVFERTFAPYQTSNLRVDGQAYPFVRLHGELALVCVSTCVATGDLGAWGEMGASQLARLEHLLSLPEVKERLRVVLMHHPPLVNRPGEDRNLRDRQALQALLAHTGAELVLHGHDHRDYFNELPGPGGKRIPVVGVGSASYSGPPDRRSRYHIFEINGATITVVTYAHDESKNGYAEVRRKVI
jgi:3',5'-cyclic AMP phosphodiesterase CpdA